MKKILLAGNKTNIVPQCGRNALVWCMKHDFRCFPLIKTALEKVRTEHKSIKLQNKFRAIRSQYLISGLVIYFRNLTTRWLRYNATRDVLTKPYFFQTGFDDLQLKFQLIIDRCLLPVFSAPASRSLVFKINDL